jgi:hypothetical protein
VLYRLNDNLDLVPFLIGGVNLPRVHRWSIQSA